MSQSNIENLINQGEHSQALKQLVDAEPSAWRDTSQLRCLRAMRRGNEALQLATQLHQALEQGEAPYSISTSERNHQLRYIALAFAECGQAKLACKIIQDLVTKSPKLAALHREHAFALSNAELPHEAEKALIEALRLRPKSATSYAQLARIYCRTGRVSEGYSAYSRAASLEPNNAKYLQQLVYWSNFLPQTTQQSNHQLARRWAETACPSTEPADITAKTEQVESVQAANVQRIESFSGKEAQIRIAFVSAEFCAQATSFYILPLLKGLDRKTFHISAYSDTKKSDSITGLIKNSCDSWCDSARLSDQDLIAQIALDRIDVLIDLSGHNGGNRLGVFAAPAAPLQISWLRYPASTGLSSVHYRITDRIADPVSEADQFNSEELLRLPNGFLCYQPLASAPDIAPSYDADTIRFGSFNNLAKVSSDCLDIWAAALHAVTNSTLCLKRHQFKHDDCKEYFIAQFAQRGIHADRLILRASNPKIEQHLNEYNNIDIAVDTTPYNGTTTTLEALWMGVPVITLSGNTHASRISASILHRLNLGNLVCASEEEFIQRVKEISDKASTRRRLRGSLRNTMRKSALMNNQQFAREFGDAIVKKWQGMLELSLPHAKLGSLSETDLVEGAL